MNVYDGNIKGRIETLLKYLREMSQCSHRIRDVFPCTFILVIMDKVNTVYKWQHCRNVNERGKLGCISSSNTECSPVLQIVSQ